jgi:membrane peptidoglycan carboxypeptidase
MVGSAGARGDGAQLNLATWRRHPGSALKPFVYATAIEQGANPASIAFDVYDVPSRYLVSGIPRREHGPVRYREALAGSYNLAAVHVLEQVGVARVMDKLVRAGAGELPGSSADYGLRLALGATKTRLLDLAAAYRVFTRGGRTAPARAVLEIAGADGVRVALPAPREQQVFSAQSAWLTLDMLADPEARRPAFGQELPADRVASATPWRYSSRASSRSRPGPAAATAARPKACSGWKAQPHSRAPRYCWRAAGARSACPRRQPACSASSYVRSRACAQARAARTASASS